MSLRDKILSNFTLSSEQLITIAASVPSTDISGKVDKVTNKSLVLDTEIAKIHASGSDNQDLSNYILMSDPRLHSPGSDNQIIPTALASLTDDSTHRLVTDIEKSTWNGKGSSNLVLGDLSSNAYPGDKGKTGYDHSQVAHAPSNAQKNSDITGAEIEAKLTGSISTHSHEQLAWLSPYRILLDSSGSHTAAKAAGTYGLGQGVVAAVTGTGTLYPLNTIYIVSADYPTVNSLATKLRVRFVIACNDVAPFTGTFVCGLHPVTRPATSGGAGLCIYTIGSAVAGSTVTGTNLAADSHNNLVGADFSLPADGFYVLAIVTNATMATSSHVHISASLQIHNA